MDKRVVLAGQFVDDVLSRPGGNDLMYIGGIYYSLSYVSGELENPLTKDELLKLTERVYEACASSVVPVLTAERTDAVCFMLEYGISCNRSPEFTSISADQARKLLLSCDMEVFTDLVDAVAVDGHHYYDSDLDVYGPELCERVNSAILEVTGKQLSLDDMVQEAVSMKEDAKSDEVQVGRIYDATNERYI